MEKNINKFFYYSILLSLVMLSLNAMAQNKVVVIPLYGENIKLEPLQNVITVAKSGGDFDGPIAAINSISPDADNRYLIVIAPGIYQLSETLIMKEYVDISGSGRNATKLIASSAPSVVTTANNASIRSMTIENTLPFGSSKTGLQNISTSTVIEDMKILVTGTGSGESRGIYSSGGGAKISNVSIEVSGGSGPQYGIYNIGSRPNIYDTSINVHGGGDEQVGIRNANSSRPIISHVEIRVSNGSSSQYGVYNSFSSDAQLSEMDILLLGSSIPQYGVFNDENSDSVVSALNIMLTGGSLQNGIYNTGSSSPTIHSTAIELENGTGNQYGVRSLSSGTKEIDRVKVDIDGGTSSYGFYLAPGDEVRNSNISVVNATSNQYGIYSSSGATDTIVHDTNISVAFGGGANNGFTKLGGATGGIVTIRGSRIFSTGTAVSASPHQTLISSSTITGGVSSSNAQCSFVFDNSGNELTSTCQLPPP